MRVGGVRLDAGLLRRREVAHDVLVSQHRALCTDNHWFSMDSHSLQQVSQQRRTDLGSTSGARRVAQRGQIGRRRGSVRDRLQAAMNKIGGSTAQTQSAASNLASAQLLQISERHDLQLAVGLHNTVRKQAAPN